MRRVLVAAATALALSVPASVASIAFVGSSSPAFASSSLTCARVKGNFSGSMTIEKCSVPSADKKTYKIASTVVSSLTSGGTFTWSNSGATTSLGSASISSIGKGRCNMYETEEDITATVTGGTSAVTQVGDSFSADVCVNKSDRNMSLVKKTTVSI